MPRRTARITGAERRADLVRVAIEQARTDGLASLTLAQVAAGGGVSKPVAYDHFGSLTGLFEAMFSEIAGEYERVVIDPLRRRAADGEVAVDLLDGLAAAYVDCSVAGGALLDDLVAALRAVDPHRREGSVDAADQYTEFVTSVFGFPPAEAYRLAVQFLGAADRLVAAVRANKVTRDEAVDSLGELFEPTLGRL